MILTTQQAADRIRVEPDTIRKAIQRGKLQARKIGRDWLVEDTEVDAYKARKQKGGRPRKDSQNA
jgi:excisionase family DNA binding protein